VENFKYLPLLFNFALECAASGLYWW